VERVKGLPVGPSDFKLPAALAVRLGGGGRNRTTHEPSPTVLARDSKNENLPPVIVADQQWISKCLVADSSLLSSSTLWKPEYVEEVKKAFVDHPDLGADSF